MKYFKKLALLACCLLLLSACKYGKVLIYNFADIKDYKKFPARAIKKGDYTFKFYQGEDSLEQKIANLKVTRSNGKKYTLNNFLDEQTRTVAFIVIRNDSVLYERYFEKYNETSILTSFSVAKSFVSALVGIAVQEGFIKDVNDPITDYLPELLDKDVRFKEITIEHALNMRTGLQFNENSYANPFSEITTLYYGNNHLKQIKNTKIKRTSDIGYEYQSINTEILGIIVERATGRSLANYFEEKLWQPLGMEFDASWNIDSKKHQAPKAYCCLNARARDFAKFGRLYLQEGEWSGEQIISKEWVNKSIQPNLKNDFYQYQWYGVSSTVRDDKGAVKYFADSLSATKAATSDVFLVSKSVKNRGKWYVEDAGRAFMAIGILGQYIYVDPSKNLIMVRFGKKGDLNYRNFFTRIGKNL